MKKYIIYMAIMLMGLGCTHLHPEPSALSKACKNKLKEFKNTPLPVSIPKVCFTGYTSEEIMVFENARFLPTK